MKKKKSDLWIKILIAVLFVSGMSLLSYSSVCNIYNNIINQRAQTKYEKTIEQNSKETNDRLFDVACAYNSEHMRNIIVDAFDEKHEQANTTSYRYDEMLNPDGSGMMAYIEIPKIDLCLSVYHGVSDETLERGVGHLAGTSLPVGGKNSHCVLAAHRGLPSAKLFTDLDQMKKGNKFYLNVLDKTLAYKIDMIEVIKPEAMNDKLSIVPNEDLVTLVTCTPYGVNTHRLLIRGHRVAADKHKPVKPLIKYIKYGSFLGLIITIWVILYVRKRNKKKNN